MSRPLTHQELKDWANKTWSEIMNQEDIISMAREAGARRLHNPELWDMWGVSNKHLERFAALVAAAEREACAKLADDIDPVWESVSVAIRARGETK